MARHTDATPLCGEVHHHTDKVRRLREQLPDESVLIDLSEIFKVFGDSSRIKILYTLFEEEMCVCDLADILGMTQSAVSHQLRLLRTAKLVKYRRDGKNVFYTLDDDHVRSIIDAGLAHVMED